jgi:molecular chaperone DnaK (HSP70)
MSRRINPPRRVRRRLPQQLAATDTESEDTVMVDAPPSESLPRARNGSQTKYLVALDYGTTYTSVSYIKYDPGKPPLTLRGQEIKSIRGWANAATLFSDQNSPGVPSESWYLDGEYLWGYKVRQRLRCQPNERLNSSNSIIRFSKLLLDDNDITSDSRLELKKILRKIGKTEHEVIKDYLMEIFKHTKKQLIERENFNTACEVELVLCVPAGWSAEALRRMQEVFGDVIDETQFGSIFNLFILHEPEAAAAYVLEALSGHADIRVCISSPKLY